MPATMLSVPGKPARDKNKASITASNAVRTDVRKVSNVARKATRTHTHTHTHTHTQTHTRNTHAHTHTHCSILLIDHST